MLQIKISKIIEDAYTVQQKYCNRRQKKGEKSFVLLQFSWK